MTPFRLSRRAVLRGLGAAIALPLLDAMEPWARLAHAGPGGSSRPNLRLAFIFQPNGIVPSTWRPEGAKGGPLGALPATLAPLEKLRADLLVISHLANRNADALGDGAGDHARSAGAFLTCAHPKKSEGRDIKLGVSADQVVAKAYGERTRLPSLELGCDRGGSAGRCDSGYSCAYSNNISWSSETTPVPKETDPRQVFERLFGAEDEGGEAVSAERLRARKSILDLVEGDAKRLAKKLGEEDRRKLDEYETSVREVERRVERAEKDAKKGPPPSAQRPDGIPGTYAEHQRLLYDMLVLAFQTDATRVGTFMLADEGSNRSYEHIGVADGHHTLSHHGGDKAMIAKVQKIDRFHVEGLAYFLERLKGVKEGSRSLLDLSMIVYGSGIRDGNAHDHADLPILVAGRGGGSIATGRHLVLPRDTPLANLYLALIQRMGVSATSFGDSKGALTQIGG